MRYLVDDICNIVVPVEEYSEENSKYCIAESKSFGYKCYHLICRYSYLEDIISEIDYKEHITGNKKENIKQLLDHDLYLIPRIRKSDMMSLEFIRYSEENFFIRLNVESNLCKKESLKNYKYADVFDTYIEKDKVKYRYFSEINWSFIKSYMKI